MKASCALKTLLIVACHCSGFAADVRVHRVIDSGLQPQVVSETNGTLHLIYFKGEPRGGDIHYVSRRPGTSEFSKPIRVNHAARTATAMGSIRGAQLAVGRNGRVHVVWNGMGTGAELAFKTPNDKAPLLYTRKKTDRDDFEPEQNLILEAYGLDGGSTLAADSTGNVYVFWHAPTANDANTDESHRRVFMVRSSDDGKTFSHETPVHSPATGACACCGMRAFAAADSQLYVLYRSATAMTNRAEILLRSMDHGLTFQQLASEPWTLSSCPMSSAFLANSSSAILAASESYGRVFLLKADERTGKTFRYIAPKSKSKYPVAIANAKGEVLLVWAEGTAWNRGGKIAWRVYDGGGLPLTKEQSADGLPAWSFPAATVTSDGNFEIFY